eukprot:Filipodium_phascolosomae@DN647_c0_g1_i1.p1
MVTVGAIDMLIRILQAVYRHQWCSWSLQSVEGSSDNYSILTICGLKGKFQNATGKWIYITIPSISLVAHPFSIVPVVHVPAHTSEESVAIETDSDRSRIRTTEAESTYKFKLCVKSTGNGAWTDKLLDLAKAKPEKMPSLYISSPYGSGSERFCLSTKFIFVCGGSGVTPVLSVVNKIEPSRVLLLVWTFRDAVLVQTAESILNTVPPSAIKYFCTCLPAHEEENRMLLRGNEHQCTFQRPNVKHLMEEYCDKLMPITTSTMCIGIFVCGPSNLSETVRSAVFKLRYDYKSRMRFIVHAEKFAL